MQTFPSLKTLGPRICVCGPSNAGKSTLAAAIGDKIGVPPVYLDLLHHQPYTNWQPRPKADFIAAHEDAIAADKWVMEGNYMGLLDRRLSRATGIVLLGTDRWSAFARYVRRTLFHKNRVGMLPGGQDSLNLEMMRFIFMEQPKKRQRDVGLLRASGLPMVQINAFGELKQLYERWGLKLP